MKACPFGFFAGVREQATARAKAKYRDLSTAAAKCAAFGRDDVCYGGLKENKQPQEQPKTTAKTTARHDKRWLVDGIHSHLSDNKTVAKMGHPNVLGLV